MKKIFILLVAFAFSLAIPNFSLTESFAQEDTTQSVSEEELNALFAEEEAQNGDTTKLSAEVSPAANESPKSTDSFGIFGTPLTDCSGAEDKLTLWQALWRGFLGGLAALFFPCTFPMIPMTMSFFLKGSEQNKKKGKFNAIFYGFAIFLVYFLISIPFNFGLSGSALSDFSTNIWLNLAFFLIFIVFAFSLFGFFDISLPSSIANKMDSKSNTGSLIGIFFMAATLAIVSFSCTGPILGLVLASAREYITPAFSAFGIGLGLPFVIFALFPDMLSKLPKSGAWMDVIKNIFGFIELAFAIKFLSNVDLALRLWIITREVFVGLWIIIFILFGLYLFGLFSFKKGGRLKRNMVTTILGVLSFVFSIYLSTDFFGGDLRLISGFPPPKEYSYRKVKPHFEQNMNDYDYAYKKAAKEGKLLFIDFTGHFCVNCRRMEENVWIDPTVAGLLKNDMVIVSLFVDQKTELEEKERGYSNELKRDRLTVGDKWSEFQGLNLKEYSQPQYAIIDPETGRIINKPLSGYNSVEDFNAFLSCALKYKSN